MSNQEAQSARRTGNPLLDAITDALSKEENVISPGSEPMRIIRDRVMSAFPGLIWHADHAQQIDGLFRHVRRIIDDIATDFQLTIRAETVVMSIDNLSNTQLPYDKYQDGEIRNCSQRLVQNTLEVVLKAYRECKASLPDELRVALTNYYAERIAVTGNSLR